MKDWKRTVVLTVLETEYHESCGWHLILLTAKWASNSPVVEHTVIELGECLYDGLRSVEPHFHQAQQMLRGDWRSFNSAIGSSFSSSSSHSRPLSDSCSLQTSCVPHVDALFVFLHQLAENEPASELEEAVETPSPEQRLQAVMAARSSGRTLAWAAGRAHPPVIVS